MLEKKKLYPILLINFLGVCRENHFYLSLKKDLTQRFNDKDEKRCDEKYFSQCDILNYMLAICEHETHIIYELYSRDNSDYEYIVFATNILMQLFLKDRPYCQVSLQELGRQIFDRTCYQLFGDKFLEDMDKFEQEHSN